MPIIYMLVGLPSSGKSTWTKNNSLKLNAVIHSSDALREELYGDESVQGNNVELFEELHKRIKSSLESGENVIYDATNISQKRRRHFVREFSKYHKKAIYFNTSFGACVLRDAVRKRKVGEEVIKRMYHNLQVPTYAEGWDEIEIVYDHYINPFHTKDEFEKLLISKPTHEHMFQMIGGLGEFKEFFNIYNMPQDSPYHTFSISRHIYYVYEYVYDNYGKVPDNERLSMTKDEMVKMLWFAVLHDVGKGHTKSFYNHNGELKRYASFLGHENVSAQIAVSILNSLGYDDDYILDVAELVQLHMRLLNASQKTEKKLLDFVGEHKFNKLMFFREADTSAK